jgi:putative membrane protein
MTKITTALIILVALLHFYFMILEMFFWTKPMGIRTFGLKKDFAEQSKVLAANQGLYNGFLAAGLVWSLISTYYHIAPFFLICIILAGAYGAYSTKNKKLFYVQSLPAIFALLACFLLQV